MELARTGHPPRVRTTMQRIKLDRQHLSHQAVTAVLAIFAALLLLFILSPPHG
jgi:hypothetical protein